MARTSYAQVKHRRCAVAGVDRFYREAGPPDAPVNCLLHGFPSSSYQYRVLETHGSDVIDLTVEFLRGAGCEVHSVV